MASADFSLLTFPSDPFRPEARPPRVMRTHFPTYAALPGASWLPPGSLSAVAFTSALSGQGSGFKDIRLLAQCGTPRMRFLCRRASVLPAASFRFFRRPAQGGGRNPDFNTSGHLAMDTLAVRLTVPLNRPVRDLRFGPCLCAHPQVSAPCRAHITKPPFGFPNEGLNKYP